VIKYLGSKRLILPKIVGAISALGARSVVDPFSGTARVGHALKAAGLRVHASDHNRYAATLARAYVAADASLVPEVARLVAEMSRVGPRAGWFTRTYAEESRYFTPANAARIEAMREWIARKELEPELEAVLLVSLMEAADRVDSTVGVQMAYLKAWAPRAHNEIAPRVPELLPQAEAGKGTAEERDALVAVARTEADVVYLDPPYNQHSYLGNYHVWETLVRWDEPEVFGVAKKRLDVKERKSAFNSKTRCKTALAEVIAACRAPWIVVSFSNEGYVSRAELEEMLRARGEVTTLAFGHPRYVGAKIGIYNPAGEKVGKIGKLRNTEHLFVAGPHALPKR
jgi:adenine-specific DNA-methyltransferase